MVEDTKALRDRHRLSRRRFLRRISGGTIGISAAALAVLLGDFTLGAEWQANIAGLPALDQNKLVIDLFAPGDANDIRRKAAYAAVGGAQYAIVNQFLSNDQEAIACVLNPVNSNLQNRSGKPLDQLIISSHGSEGGMIYYNQNNGNLNYAGIDVKKILDQYSAMSQQLNRSQENPLAKNIILFGCEVLQQQGGQPLSDDQMRSTYGTYASNLNTNFIAADSLEYDVGGTTPHVQADLVKIKPDGSIERRQINSVDDYRNFLGEPQPSVTPTTTSHQTR